MVVSKIPGGDDHKHIIEAEYGEEFKLWEEEKNVPIANIELRHLTSIRTPYKHENKEIESDRAIAM